MAFGKFFLIWKMEIPCIKGNLLYDLRNSLNNTDWLITDTPCSCFGVTCIGDKMFRPDRKKCRSCLALILASADAGEGLDGTYKQSRNMVYLAVIANH